MTEKQRIPVTIIYETGDTLFKLKLKVYLALLGKFGHSRNRVAGIVGADRPNFIRILRRAKSLGYDIPPSDYIRGRRVRVTSPT